MQNRYVPIVERRTETKFTDRGINQPARTSQTLIRIGNDSTLLQDRLTLYRNSLLKLARHLLHEEFDAHRAVRNCCRSALACRGKFSTDGAFCSWLFRVLIREAVQILKERPGNPLAARHVKLGEPEGRSHEAR